MGRPAFAPTDLQRTLVSELAACGVRQELIAKRIEIDIKTLRKACRRELQEGKQDACAIVAESLFRKATGDGKAAITAAIFWLKTQAGWRENHAIDINMPPRPIVESLPKDCTQEEALQAYLSLIKSSCQGP
jgi:hypothetical protein